MIFKSNHLQRIVASVCIISAITTSLLGCAGATPHPVPQQQPGDENLTCSQIRQEMADNQTKVLSLIPQENKTGKNVALGVAGAFFIVPWFFMDFSDAERIEVQAYELRNNYLRTLANKKHCGAMPRPMRFVGHH